MLTDELRKAALALGFDLFGVASAADPTLASALERYATWLERGYGATMGYLARHAELKSDPSKLLPGCRTIVCLGTLYGESVPPEDPTRAQVSLYTRGEDYHELLGDRLEDLSRWLAEKGIESRPFVDAQPVLERFWGWRAGLGWIGKNAMLINRKVGSYFFIGGLLVAEELDVDSPGIDHCGRCRKCIEACPTVAIQDERFIDSEKCIAFHTIENKGSVPEPIMERSGRWIGGCDICQSVCPWNDPVTPGQSFDQRNAAYNAELRELAGWSAEQFKLRIGNGIAMGRMRFAGFLRNIAIAISNSGLAAQEQAEALDRLMISAQGLPEGPGQLAAFEAIAWARQRLSNKKGNEGG